MDPLAQNFLWLVFHIDSFSHFSLPSGKTQPFSYSHFQVITNITSRTSQSMANTFSKVLVNTAYLAAKLMRNDKKKNLAVNKASIPWQPWPGRCNKYKWLHRHPETRGANSPCPFNTPKSSGTDKLSSQRPLIYSEDGNKRWTDSSSRGTSGHPSVARVHGVENSQHLVLSPHLAWPRSSLWCLRTANLQD